MECAGDALVRRWVGCAKFTGSLLHLARYTSDTPQEADAVPPLEAAIVTVTVTAVAVAVTASEIGSASE